MYEDWKGFFFFFSEQARQQSLKSVTMSKSNLSLPCFHWLSLDFIWTWHSPLFPNRIQWKFVTDKNTSRAFTQTEKKVEQIEKNSLRLIALLSLCHCFFQFPWWQLSFTPGHGGTVSSDNIMHTHTHTVCIVINDPDRKKVQSWLCLHREYLRCSHLPQWDQGCVLLEMNPHHCSLWHHYGNCAGSMVAAQLEAACMAGGRVSNMHSSVCDVSPLERSRDSGVNREEKNFRWHIKIGSVHVLTWWCL